MVKITTMSLYFVEKILWDIAQWEVLYVLLITYGMLLNALWRNKAWKITW